MKPWPIITEENEVRIDLPEFYDTYFGDVDTMTPEEWRVVHMISATPMLYDACKLDYGGGLAYNLPALLDWAASSITHSTPKDKGNVLPEKLERAAALIRAAIAQAEEAQ